MADAVGPAAAPVRSDFPWRLWTAICLVLAVVVVGLAYVWAQRTPEVVERALPAITRQLPPEVAARAAQLRSLRDQLELRLANLLDTIAAPSCQLPRVLDAERHRATLLRESSSLEGWRTTLRGDSAAGGAAIDVEPAAIAAAEEDEAARPSVAPDEAVAAVPPPPTASLSPLAAAELAALLERAAAFVLVMRSGSDLGTGTAFFIDDRLLVTNRHVVDGAAGDRIAVTSGTLGRMHPVDVVATSRGAGLGAPDFALLRLRDGRAPASLRLSGERHKLASVTAAGYPGADLELDPGFLRLLRGDGGAAPDLHMSRGEIRSVQPLGDVTRIVHTADVLKGYSGGPLVDACGRVVGVNTFIQVDQEQASRRSNALTVQDLAAFLTAEGTPVRLDERICD